MNSLTWCPLAATQHSRWLLYQLAPEQQGLHNNAFAATVRGELPAPLLAAALDRLTARHPMLGAQFRDGEGRPEQAIGLPVAHQVDVIDARELDDSAFRQRLEHDIRKPFDLARPPLMRAALYRRRDQDPVLLLVFDHLVCDGWSYWRLLGELGGLLGARQSGDLSAAAPYADYVGWQREWLAGPEAEQQWQYWSETLAAPLPILDLPSDRARPPSPRGHRQIHTVTLPSELTASIRRLAAQQRASVYTVLLAAYQILLHRHTGQDDIVVGSPMPGRGDGRWDRTVGDFVNPIAVRTRFHGDPDAAQVLRAVRAGVLRGMANQDYPFSRLVERLGLSGTTGAHPVFQTMFVFQNARPAQDLAGLWNDSERTVAWGPVELGHCPVRQSGGMHLLGMVLEVMEFDTHIRCDFKFDPDMFDAATVERLGACFGELITSMAADPLQAVGRLTMLGAAQRQLVLEQFNATEAAFPRDRLIHQLFEEQARRRPGAVALVCDERQLSYAELNERANRIAHRLLGLGVRPDDRVAICTGRGVELVAGLIGILKAGAAYVPLDPAYPQERIAHMLGDSAPVALLTQSALRASLPCAAPACVELDTDAALAAQPGHDPAVPGLNSSHLAYVIYTSGSTGLPKGVLIEHINAVNFIAWATASFDAGCLANTLFATSISFDLAVYELFAPLSAGTTVTLVRDILASPPEPATVSLINTVPSAMAAMLDARRVPASARTLNLAGEPLKASLAERIFAHSAIERLCNLYGPTETTTYSTWTSIRRGQPFPGHIGRPIANTRVYILDAHGQPVPVGVAGEIHIGGAGVARGYLNRPDLTAERFLADPFSGQPGARMYKTGDLGRWLPDGAIDCLGRNDFQVKIRGFRIELGEIEARLLACAGVVDAVVVAREDQPGDRRLVAYLLADGAQAPDAAALRAQLASALPDYMIPGAFVTLDAFPLTPNGKLDRRALPAPAGGAVASRAYEAPAGEVEQTIAAIWQDLLGLERVGRHDHFFELGGHSLLVPPMVDRLRLQGFDVQIRAAFANATLTELAAALSGADATRFAAPPNRIPEAFGHALEQAADEEFTF